MMSVSHLELGQEVPGNVLIKQGENLLIGASGGKVQHLVEAGLGVGPGSCRGKEGARGVP